MGAAAAAGMAIGAEQVRRRLFSPSPRKAQIRANTRSILKSRSKRSIASISKPRVRKQSYSSTLGKKVIYIPSKPHKGAGVCKSLAPRTMYYTGTDQILGTVNKSRWALLGSGTHGIGNKDHLDQIRLVESNFAEITTNSADPPLEPNTANNTYRNTNRIFIQSETVEYRLKNQKDVPVTVTFYDMVCTNDVPFTSGSSLESQLSSGWNHLDNPWSTAVDISNTFSTHPMLSAQQNKIVQKHFKILKSWTVTLQATEEYTVKQIRKTNKFRNFVHQDSATSTCFAWKGEREFFVRVAGAIAHDTTTSSLCGTAPTAVDIYISGKIVYKFPKDQDRPVAFFADYDTLLTTAETATDADVVMQQTETQ